MNFEMPDLKLDIKLMSFLIIGFIIATIVGTVSHEIGHWGTAKILGYNASFNYGSMWFEPSDKEITKFDSLLVIMGGPVQTITVGTIGLVLILYKRKSYFNARELSFGQWTLLFMALFWLRQFANFVMFMIQSFLKGRLIGSGDEMMIGRKLGFPGWIILGSSGMIALIIALLLIFKFIPTGQRLTFVIAGMIGGTLGFYLWLLKFGPMVFP